jgi:hypothetical protein
MMTDYVLALSEAEVARYRFMAQRAALDEGDQWGPPPERFTEPHAARTV